MFDLRHETPPDVAPREALLDRCFGPSRFAKTCERLREGRRPAKRLAFALTCDEALVGTVRLWDVMAGPDRPALLLGPVAVDPALQGLGLGERLIRAGLDAAGALGHRAVILVGDERYYRRFGFGHQAVAGLWLPGPYEIERFLGLELAAGALAGASGLVAASGRPSGSSVPVPEMPGPIAGLAAAFAA